MLHVLTLSHLLCHIQSIEALLGFDELAPTKVALACLFFQTDLLENATSFNEVCQGFFFSLF